MRKTTPAAMMRARGNPSKRATPEEARTISEDPTAPEYLSPYALECWKEAVAELTTMGVAASADRHMISVYVGALDTYRQTVLTLARDGLFIEGAVGGMMKHPAVMIQNQAIQVIWKVGSELGFSPTARARIAAQVAAAGGNKAGSDLDEFLRRTGKEAAKK